MRFLLRALSGVFLLALTLGLLVLGVGVLIQAGADGDDRGGGRPAQERVYTVSVAPVQLATLSPVSRAFGRLQSWQTADVRSASAGTVTAMGDAVRDGGRVSRGDLLFEIDPVTAENTLASRETDLAEARTELTDAQRALELSIEELAAAESQHRLRERALVRAQDLKRRGFDTDAGVESAELALASSAQALVTRKQAIAQGEARVARAEIGIERRVLARDAAVRDLEDTRIHAPFEGVLSEVDAVVGRRVGANERLATLIDPTALEVAFRVSVEAFANLVDVQGEVLRQPLTVEFEMGERDIQLQARISRISAEVGDGQSGRLVYAELQPPLPGALTVGDFVTVAIEEPALSGVALIPRVAATDDGRVLVVDEEDRLVELRSTVERRQGDSLIVSGLPTDARLVLARTAQLGPGVRVKTIGPDRQIEQRETVKLTAAQQTQLRAVIGNNNRMPADVKARLLERIDSGEISAAMWQRFENRMGAGAGQAPVSGDTGGDTVALDDDRRARLREAVNANTALPDSARERLLEALEQPRVPAAMVERIESRLGQSL
ncbi:MAG: HlyD family efflux transporter periplasmic adaptor subunit [Pseudomonadota bacterium]